MHTHSLQPSLKKPGLSGLAESIPWQRQLASRSDPLHASGIWCKHALCELRSSCYCAADWLVPEAYKHCCSSCKFTSGVTWVANPAHGCRVHDSLSHLITTHPRNLGRQISRLISWLRVHLFAPTAKQGHPQPEYLICVRNVTGGHAALRLTTSILLVGVSVEWPACHTPVPVLLHSHMSAQLK